MRSISSRFRCAASTPSGWPGSFSASGVARLTSGWPVTGDGYTVCTNVFSRPLTEYTSRARDSPMCAASLEQTMRPPTVVRMKISRRSGFSLSTLANSVRALAQAGDIGAGVLRVVLPAVPPGVLPAVLPGDGTSSAAAAVCFRSDQAASTSRSRRCPTIQRRSSSPLRPAEASRRVRAAADSSCRARTYTSVPTITTDDHDSSRKKLTRRNWTLLRHQRRIMATAPLAAHDARRPCR